MYQPKLINQTSSFGLLQQTLYIQSNNKNHLIATTMQITLTQCITMYKTKHSLYFQHSHHTLILKIDRQTGKCSQITQNALYSSLKLQQKGFNKLKIMAIYGIIIVQNVPYLAVVSQAKKVSTVKQNSVYEVQNLLYVPFDKEKQISASPSELQTLKYINSDLVQGKFYFSYDQDLTKCFRKKTMESKQEKLLHVEYSQSKFFWNQKPLEFLQVNNLSKPWSVPMIQGYVGCYSQHGLEYRIIARRSKHMSGTRYNNRGINLEGFASNFVQIEERIEYDGKVFTFLSIRGSAPIHWRQENGLSEIEFPHVEDKDHRGLTKHYDSLATQYQSTITTINLLSELKSHQKSLSQRFSKILSKCDTFQQHYYTFDFNDKKQTLHDDIDQFVKGYEMRLGKDNFDGYDLKSDKRTHKQQFIPRVNCLDCIDRTNVICCRIGECFVKKVMAKLNFSMTEEFHNSYLEHWAALGNKLSQIYCGTHSVAEHLTLKQEASYWSSITSSFRSMTRFLNASSSDQFKQQCNLYLLRQHQRSITTYFGNNIARKKINVKEYAKVEEINFSVVTWNVAGMSANGVTQQEKQLLFFQLFGPKQTKSPSLIFITLQQIVQLTSYNVVTNDNSLALSQWQKTLLSIVNYNNVGYTYKLFFSEALVGIASIIFVKNSLDLKVDMLNKVQKLFNYEVKRGYAGNLGNKGAIVCGFRVCDTVVVSYACHLAAGDEKSQERAEDVRGILKSLGQNEEAKRSLGQVDYEIFAGDLNFRLNTQDQTVRQILNEAKLQSNQKGNPTRVQQLLKQLLFYDQILSLISKQSSNSNQTPNNPLHDFKQNSISFLPTYRYIKGTTQHDQKRKPAWTDRVFYRTEEQQQISCDRYCSIDQIMLSDHKPVIAQFRIQVRTQNKEKKQRLVEEYLKQKNENSQISIQQPHYNFPKTRYNYG